MSQINDHSILHVYLFGEVIEHLLMEQHILTNIEEDLSVSIDYVKQKKDSFLKIIGHTENAHKARIILQELEKNLYREAYLNKI
jgi:hypothetical protein